MDDKKFEEIVRKGIKAIPKNFLEKLNNIDICIEQEPTPYQLQELKTRKNSLILGLYEGVPQTERQHYGQVLPDKITIFKKPIERVAGSRQRRGSSEATQKEIKEIVTNTVWHEIAHHFGMSEKRVRKAERQRKNNF